MTFVAVFSPNLRFPNPKATIIADFVEQDGCGFRFYKGEKAFKHELVAAFESGTCCFVYEINCVQKKEITKTESTTSSSEITSSDHNWTGCRA